MIKEDVINAYNFAKNAHEGVMRKNSNLPYFVHPKMVARIVESYNCDSGMVSAALLHDTIEDTDVTYEDIRERFGHRIADLVMEVTNTEERDNKELYANRVDYMVAKMLGMSDDALVIKLADRLNNVAYLDYDANNPEAIRFARYYHDKTMDTIEGFLLYGPSLKKIHTDLLKAIMNELYRVDTFLRERNV